MEEKSGTYEYIFYNSRGQVIARGTESFII